MKRRSITDASRRGIAIAALALGLALALAACNWFGPPDVPVVPTVGFAPLASAVHTLVTIVGTGFGAPTGDVVVTFDGVEADIVTWSDTNIQVRIPVLPTPAGQRAATIVVEKGGEALGTGTYTVLRGILFETLRDGNAEIYVMNPDGTQPTNLTDHAAFDTAASWSPDGTKILFESMRDGNWEIYVMRADGSNLTNVSNDSRADYGAVWAPNGAKIAFMSDREGGGLPPILDADSRLIIPLFDVEVFVVNADGSGLANVTNSPAWDGYPSWSPDSQRLAFETDRDDGPVVLDILPQNLGREIYAVDVDGTDLARLSNDPGDDGRPVWSPDGTRIAFQSTRDGNPEIYVMNANGTGQVRLTNHPDPDVLPGWSPSGDWITFHSYRDGDDEIYKTNPTGTMTVRLTTAAGTDWGPSWSPDGTQIVFASERDGNLDVYRMNADGTSLAQLTDESAVDVNPFWGTYGGRLSP